MPGRKPIALPLAELLALYESGWSTVALAARYGCSPATVNKRLRALGVALRTARYPRMALEEAALRRLYLEELLPIAAIAAHFGVSPSTVSNRRRAFGIPPRRSTGRHLKERRLIYRCSPSAIAYRKQSNRAKPQSKS